MLEMKVNEILTKCDKYKENVGLLKRQEETLEEIVQEYEEAIEDKLEERMLCEKASALYKQISDDRNKVAKRQIEDVLNYALNKIPLDQKYRAEIEEIASKRSGKEMVITLIDQETGYRRTLRNQTGTWVAQLVSFILNMIIIKFSGSSRIMVLDEVFSGMEDVEMVKVFGEIITSLAENEDFQILMVEHRKELDNIAGIHNIELEIPSYEQGTTVVNR